MTAVSPGTPCGIATAALASRISGVPGYSRSSWKSQVGTTQALGVGPWALQLQASVPQSRKASARSSKNSPTRGTSEEQLKGSTEVSASWKTHSAGIGDVFGVTPCWMTSVSKLPRSHSAPGVQHDLP